MSNDNSAAKNDNSAAKNDDTAAKNDKACDDLALFGLVTRPSAPTARSQQDELRRLALVKPDEIACAAVKSGDKFVCDWACIDAE